MGYVFIFGHWMLCFILLPCNGWVVPRETLFFLNTKYVRHDIKKIDLHVSTGSILCVAGKQ
jgi:hypothetical protein